MLVVLAIPVMSAFPIVIPFMVVFETTVWAIPITGIEPLAIMAWADPMRAFIRRPAPIAFMPAIVSSDRIPVAFDPEKIRTWSRRWGNYHSRRRWRTDSDAHTDLGVCAAGAEKQSPGKQCKAQQVFHT